MTEEPSDKNSGEEESFADLFESYSDITSEDLRVRLTMERGQPKAALLLTYSM